MTWHTENWQLHNLTQIGSKLMKRAVDSCSICCQVCWMKYGLCSCPQATPQRSTAKKRRRILGEWEKIHKYSKVFMAAMQCILMTMQCTIVNTHQCVKQKGYQQSQHSRMESMVPFSSCFVLVCAAAAEGHYKRIWTAGKVLKRYDVHVLTMQ